MAAAIADRSTADIAIMMLDSSSGLDEDQALATCPALACCLTIGGMEDPAVEALRKLIGDSPTRRAEIADVLDCNEQTLYQIIRGLPLKSGKPRSVGRKLRAALDEHFPGWLEGTTVASPAPTLAQALPIVLDALAAAPARAELRQLLPMLVDTDAPAYRQRLAELLSTTADRGELSNPADPARQAELDQLSQQAEELHASDSKRRRVARR